MKRLLFLMTSFLFYTTTFSQNKIDTTVTYQWISNTWQPEIRFVYTYNSSCLATTMLMQKWQTGSSSWADTLLTTNTYTAGDNLNQSTMQVWNSNTSVWDNLSRQTYSYNSNNLVDSITEDLWLSNNWNTFSLTIYNYNPDNTVDSILNQVGGGPWINSSLQIYSYNANKNVRELITKTWNVISWKNLTRNAYSYNGAGKELTDTLQTWGSSQWNNAELTINTYDGSNYLTNALSQKWNGTSSTWDNDTQTNFTNNTDGTPSVAITQDWDSGTSSWMNSSKTTFSYSGCLLPLTLLDFTAQLNGKEVQLEWTTVSENNTKNFIVQRSNNGINFENIGTVNAAGNSSQKITYSFSDAAAFQQGIARLYYRLQMNDKDGKYSYSRIAAVNITAEGRMISIYPNPVKDNLILNFNSAASQYQIRITDQNGKVVYQQQLNNIQQGGQQNINVSNLGKGIYYIQIINGSNIESLKFMKY